MVDINHSVDVSHKLQMMLSPKLLRMLKLLNLPFHELVEKIDKEAEENPMLEIEKPETLFEYLKYLDSHKKERKEVDYREYEGLKNLKAAPRSLRDHLLEQLKLTELKGSDFEIAEDIINHIDSRGYLINYDNKDIEPVLKTIQTFEPEGVGARNLCECLLIQIREYVFEDPELEDILVAVVEKHLDDLSKKEFKKIADSLGVVEEDIIEVANYIKENLTPYPAASFSEAEKTVVPSFAIEASGGKVTFVNLEERYGPKIRISAQYQKMLRDPRTDENTVKFLREHDEKSKEIIEHLLKRQKTGSQIMELIVKKQEDFFKEGVEYFRPLLQKDIAQELGLHPSTISRAIAEKYVQTPRGLFSLKYLCPREIKGFSSFEIKSKIKNIIEKEDLKNPFTDAKILALLKSVGMNISKRTVSSFRKELGIKSYKERKK